MQSTWSLKRRQGGVFLDPKRFGIVVTGRRWAKTTTLLLKLHKWMYDAPPYTGGIWGYFAPTYKQAKLIAWDILKQVIPPNRRRGKPNESDLMITLRSGHQVRLFGMDKSEHLFGMKLLGGIGDEYDQWKRGVYKTVIRPALSDTKGNFWFAGNPDSNKNQLKDLYDEVGIRLKKDPNAPWSRYHYRSVDGGYIDPEELEEAKRELDERTYREQYEASFLDIEGQVYYAFSFDKNVCEVDPFRIPVKYNPRLPIRLFWDFNVTPFCVGAAHFIPRIGTDSFGRKFEYNDIHSFDEFRIRNSNTPEMAKHILEKYKSHQAGLIIYGDASWKSRHTASSMSDYQIIIDIFKNFPGFQVRVKDSNPAVKDRINSVNSKLTSYDGKRHTFINPFCKWLIKDLMNVKRKEGSMDLDKSDLELTHMSDGFGYMCDYEFPVIRGYVS